MRVRDVEHHTIFRHAPRFNSTDVWPAGELFSFRRKRDRDAYVAGENSVHPGAYSADVPEELRAGAEDKSTYNRHHDPPAAQQARPDRLRQASGQASQQGCGSLCVHSQMQAISDATPTIRPTKWWHLVLAWSFVGIPLGWGVIQTVFNAMKLFQ